MSINSRRSGPQKNLPRTKLGTVLSWCKSPLFIRLVVGVGLFAFISMLAYSRYPTYLDAPSFYSEDGTLFAKNIVDNGFWSALFTPFNGYFIVGLYLLEGLGFVANHLFFGGSFLSLPQGLALASYGFWALLCTLPVLLFWHDVRRKRWLILIALTLALLPLPGFNYAVFGTIGNYKFAFLFIAFLLIIKRWQLGPKSRWVYLCDAALALCVFTNATVYLLLPFALLPYWPGRPKLASFAAIKAYLLKLLRTPGCISLLALCAVALAQIVIIALRGGVDTLAGYLQEPYEFTKTIEIFLQRTLLFPFDHGFAKQLNDVLVVGMTVVGLAALWKFARREDRRIVVFGLWTALAATALFVSQRTGVSQFFSHYQSSGTDHFFYAQNLVFLFTVLYVLSRRFDLLEDARRRALSFLLLGLVLIAAFAHSDMGSGARMNRATGPLYYAAQQACATTTEDPVQVPIYPVGAVFLPLDRRTYCTPALQTNIPARDPLPLVPVGNNYRIVGKQRLTQTFTARFDQLCGVSVFFSNFGGGSPSTYRLRLLDASCTKTLRVADFSAALTRDNAYYDIPFRTITRSKHVQYCFTVEPQKLVSNTAPLALQLSAPDVFPSETAAQDAITLPEDIVFDVIYLPRTPGG